MAMHTVLCGVLVAGAVGLPASAAAARSVETEGGESGSITLYRIQDNLSAVTLESIPLEDVEGLGVYSRNGERIGEVEELLGDQSGILKALAIRIEEASLGLGGRAVIVPIDQIIVDAEQRRLILRLPGSEIAKLPRLRE